MKRNNYSQLRRKVIVDPKFQSALTIRAVAFLLFMLVGMSVGLFLPLVNQIRGTDANPGDTRDPAVVILYMHEHFWPIALSFLILAVLGVVVISHRIAGPLVRVKRNLRSVGKGILPRPMKTRDKDYLQEEVEVLNDMVRNLGRRFDELKNAGSDLDESIASLEEQATLSADPELQDTLATVSAQANELNVLLAQFRWEGDPAPEHIRNQQPHRGLVATES